MTDWPETTVGNCLEPLALQKMRKVLSRDYKSSGSFPIVDQGQRLIAGWTDDESGLISTHLPVVVFGDHTRAFKYVDFPFVRGADGTQLLKPKAGIDPLFFYYACRAIELPSRGYNRHFKALKEQEIPTPPLQEQKSIAQALRRIDDALSIQDEQLQTSLALKRASMHTLFTRGLRGEAQKETEIGPLPEGWEQMPLGDLCKGLGGAIQTGPFGSQLHKHDYQETGVPVVNPTHLNAGRIDHENVPRISDENAHRLERHRLSIGDIVFARRGQIGRMARVTESEEGWLCGTGSFLVRARHPFVDNRFLHFQLSTEPIARWLTAHAAGAIMPNLNNVVLRQIPVFLPPVDEQREIAGTLDAIDRKIALHQRKRAVLEELFRALLHKLMTGEIQVKELELGAATR